VGGGEAPAEKTLQITATVPEGKKEGEQFLVAYKSGEVVKQVSVRVPAGAPKKVKINVPV